MLLFHVVVKDDVLIVDRPQGTADVAVVGSHGIGEVRGVGHVVSPVPLVESLDSVVGGGRHHNIRGGGNRLFSRQRSAEGRESRGHALTGVGGHQDVTAHGGHGIAQIPPCVKIRAQGLIQGRVAYDQTGLPLGDLGVTHHPKPQLGGQSLGGGLLPARGVGG